MGWCCYSRDTLFNLHMSLGNGVTHILGICESRMCDMCAPKTSLMCLVLLYIGFFLFGLVSKVPIQTPLYLP